jgi:hypothetical protein
MADYAVMPKADYQDACNAVREKTGGTGAIKSGDLGSQIRSITTGPAGVESCLWRNVVGNGAQSMLLSADDDLMTQLYNNGSFYVTISDQKGKISYVPNALLLGRYNSTMSESIRGTGIYCTDKIGGIAWGGSVVKQVTFMEALGGISIMLNSPYFFDDGEYAITVSKL